jgi:hypothetical protein
MRNLFAGRAGVWVRVVGSLLAIALLVWILPWPDLVSAARRVSLRVWLGVLAGFLTGHLLGAFKWTYLQRRMGVPVPWRLGGSCYALGLFANLCLPGIVGGDVVRAAAVTRRVGRLEAVALAGLGDRLLDVLALGFLLTGGVIAAGAGEESAARNILVLLAVAGSVALLAGSLAMRRPLARWPSHLRRPVGRARVAVRHLARRPGAVAVSLISALSIQGGFVLLNVALGADLGVSVPLAAWFVAWPLAKLAGLLPISLGGLGVRDAAFGSLLAGFGAAVATGVVVSLVWQSILVCAGLLAGGVWWWFSGSFPSTARVMANTPPEELEVG